MIEGGGWKLYSRGWGCNRGGGGGGSSMIGGGVVICEGRQLMVLGSRPFR